MRRLRLHSGLRGRLHDGGIRRVRRHSETPLPSAALRSGREGTGDEGRGVRGHVDATHTQRTTNTKDRAMTKHKKGTGKPKAGILRPWLVDVPVDQLR